MGPPGMEISEVVAKRGYHCLRSRPVRPPIPNWHAFLVCWNNAEDHQHQMGLLHEGYTVPLGRFNHDEKEYTEEDRHIFYLTIADGWNESNFPCERNFEYLVGYDEGGKAIKKGPMALCRDLAFKAFSMLVTNFLKQLEEPVGRHHDEAGRKNKAWERLITAEDLLTTIQNFFRIEEDARQWMIIHNLSGPVRRSHQEEEAITFLLNLARFIWQWQEPEIPSYEKPEVQEKLGIWVAETRQRVEAAKPWLIEVLCWLDRLDILDKHILELSQPCLAKLREVALRWKFTTHRHPQLVGEDRRVKTIEEAYSLGSKSAMFLVRRQIMTREFARLKRVRKSELAVAEARERAREAKVRKK